MLLTAFFYLASMNVLPLSLSCSHWFFLMLLQILSISVVVSLNVFSSCSYKGSFEFLLAGSSWLLFVKPLGSFEVSWFLLAALCHSLRDIILWSFGSVNEVFF